MNFHRGTAIGVLSMLLSAAAFAQTSVCQPPTPDRIFISWFGEQSGCGPFSGQCTANETIQFMPVAFLYSFSVCTHTFAWVFDDGGSSQLFQPTHQFSSAGSHTVTVHIVNNAGEITLGVPVSVNGDGGTKVVAIQAFTATPSRVLRGQAVRLAWSTVGASVVRFFPRIDPKIDDFGPNTTATFVPLRSGTYTLTATGDAGSLDRTIFIEVDAPRQRAARP